MGKRSLAQAPGAAAAPAYELGLQKVPVGLLQPAPYNPRTLADER